MSKVLVAHRHDPADLHLIELAVVPRGGTPGAADWRPAYRDMERGRPVVWIRLAEPLGSREVWVRDATGERKTKPV